jgi:hypothetical protein
MNAERTGFEPVMEISPHTGLANRRYRPLSHLSKSLLASGRVFLRRREPFPETLEVQILPGISGSVKRPPGISTIA